VQVREETFFFEDVVGRGKKKGGTKHDITEEENGLVAVVKSTSFRGSNISVLEKKN